MQQAIVSTLPFLGQIVKITTRDGKEYDAKISEELSDNDKVFSIMFRNHSGSSGSGSGSGYNSGYNGGSTIGNSSINNSQNNNKILKNNFINRKIDYTKAGTSICLDDISKQPFKLNF